MENSEQIEFVATMEDLKLKKGKISLIDMKLRCVFGHDLWSQLGDIALEDAIEVKMVVTKQLGLFDEEEAEEDVGYEVVDDYQEPIDPVEEEEQNDETGEDREEERL